MAYQVFDVRDGDRIKVTIPGKGDVILWAERSQEYDDAEVMINAPRDIVIEREEVRRRLNRKGRQGC